VLNEADRAYLEGLRTTTTTVLREAIGSARDVAVLDAPNQRNVGDSLIWAGELAYFERLGVRVRYVSDLSGYNAGDLRKAMPSGVVLLHGGGNFGDLWPGHQKHREQIARDLPDYRIVQLPQSIYFRDEERATSANTIIGGHPDFRLLVRDSESMSRARRQLPAVPATYCHDMALGYAPSGSDDRRDARRVLVIARADVERSSGLYDLDPGWLPGAELIKTDWGPGAGWPERRWQAARAVTRADRRIARLRRRRRVPGARSVHSAATRAVTTLNKINVDGAIELYATAGLVVVDRLHAHVLAGLLGIEHIVLDNNYRKIGAVFDEYTGGLSTAHYATSLDEARDMAMQAVTA